MTCLAIIPARGGSKGVPRKNVLPVGGLPLIAHAIRAALAAKRVTRLVVSTDDDEIARVSRRFGAEVILRPDDISGDSATSESALVHCLRTLGETEQYKPELTMLIQCTSPLTSAADLDGLVESLRAAAADSAFIAVPFHHFLWQRGADGQALGINHDGVKRKRRQELTPAYLENGAAYVMRTSEFLETEERFCGKVVMHLADPSHALEIDDPVDVVKADALLLAQRRSPSASLLPSPLEAVVFDFDGVFTDNRVLVDEEGREAVFCDRGDGMGLERLRDSGVHLLVLSKERNSVVSRRAEKLKLECQQATDDKVSFLKGWLADKRVAPAATVYVGNDINDIEPLLFVGCGVVVADAHEDARACAQIVLTKRGGRGAIRELCDLIASRPR
jgi:YrbI family 3-deoxy-D-manno-octulosonate 8-phosphate phosphatase